MAELCSPEARQSRGRVKKQHGEAKVEVLETNQRGFLSFVPGSLGALFDAFSRLGRQ